MSHSVVTDFPTQTDNTLVVVVNRNGEVSVDQETLEGFMKLGNTEVSILRVDNEDGETVDMTLDTFDRTDTMDDLSISVEDELLRNYNSFRMDHCYTPLTSPSQHKPPVPPDDFELDDLAHTLSILEGSDKSSATPVKIQQKIVPKDKVTELNKVNKIGVQQPQKFKGVKTVVHKAQKVPSKKLVPQQIESDISDDDLDSDFEESPTQLKKRIYNKRRNAKLEQPDLPSSEVRNKIVKVRKGVKHIVYKATKQPAEPKPEPVPPPAPPAAVPDLIKSPDSKKLIKKEKKPVKPVVVDDGIALFSTPDIIRRVGSGKTPEKTPESPESPKVIKAAKIEDRSRSDSRQSTEKVKTSQRLSLDSKVISPKNLSADFGIDEKPVEDLDRCLINQIPNLIPDPPNLSSVDNETFENIAQAVGNLESDIPTDPQLIRSIIHTDVPVKFQAVLDSQSVINPQDVDQTLNLEAAGLDIDQGILDNINADELIPEDILFQVAKLVENPDVQNVIDRTLVEGLDTIQNQIADSVQSQLPVPVQINQQIPTEIDNTQNLLKNTTQRPIQIVRPDGRVLILPPIEKPATRSSQKKKQEPPQAQHRLQQRRPPQAHPPPPSQPQQQQQLPQQVIPVVAPPKVHNAIRPKHPPGGLQTLVGSDVDTDSDESWNSEDDPDRLWCICKQPHNNRFMICCDTCEDWFHGKCVNVTKAMGQQMEQQGKEWMCPNCVKKLNSPVETQQQHHPPPATVKQKMAGDIVHKRKSVDNSPACIVCASPSRANSVYCSDTCILKHAQGVEKDTTNKAQKVPVQRIIVFERSTGKCLSGPNAPSAANLKQWLREHPGFEVVRPVMKQQNLVQSKLQLVKNPQGKEGVALSVNRKGVQVGIMPHSSKQPNTIKLIPAAKLNVPGMRNQLVKTVSPATPSKVKLTQTTLKSPPTTTPVKIKPPTPTTTPKQEKTQARERKQKLFPSQQETPKQNAQENIRDTVKKTLYEHLMTRVKECDDLKFTDDEVDKMANDIETQLYKLFGDSGPKYRTKYRSLIFNIKDTKNQTLWRRICEKDIAPAQLVRLSPEEMASQELARWRERENKHQLDMIKKSELEMLTINRTYVLKTHKGEHVIVDRPMAKVDSTEIMPGLGADSTSEPDASTLTDKSDATDHSLERRSEKHSRRDRDRDKRSSKDRSISKDSRTSKDHGSSKSRSKRSRSHDRDRSSHRSDRKRSRSRDRHHRSSHKSSRHKRDKHSTEHLDKKSREILDNLENNKIVAPPEDRLWKHVPQQDILVATPDSDSDHEPSSTVTIPTPPRSSDQEEPQPAAPKLPEYIPEPLPPPKIEPKVETSPSKPAVRTDPRIKQVEVVVETPKNDSPQPTPSLSPSTSPVPPSVPSKFTSESKEAIIWEGNINMVDVAKFFITLHEVSGDCSGLGTELPPTLEIVGRISPDTVWEYIGKMRRSNSKLISILRLTAGNGEEKMSYIALYSYLSSRDRLGVIKSTNNAVKDFYILPLASHVPVPQALLPLSGPGFEEARPHLLLGIIVRAKRKRSITENVSESSKSKRNRVENSPPQATAVTAQPSRSYTPPPTRDPRVRLPTVPATPNDEDEPYSPEDSDPDNTLPAAVIRTKSLAKTTPVQPIAVAAAVAALKGTDIASVLALKSNTFSEPKPTVSFEPFSNKFDAIPGLEDQDTGVDLARKMAELDKCIEKQKEEIRSISQDIVSSGAATNMATNLSSISLPSNLQQILDSIKNIPATTATSSTEEYCPSAPGYKTSVSDELTIPLLLPKLSSRQVKSETSTIPLKLPVAPREPQLSEPTSIKSTPIATKVSPIGTPIVSKPTSTATKATCTKLTTPKPTPIQVSLLKLAGISTSPISSPNVIPNPLPAPVTPPTTSPINYPTTPISTNLPSPVVLPNLSVPPPSSPSSVNYQKISSPSTALLIPPAPILTPPGVTPIVTSAEVKPVIEAKPVSVLSSLSEEELIRKAAEMLGETHREETPEPEEVDEVTSGAFVSAPIMYTPAPPMMPPAPKRTKFDVSQPPVPGLEDEF